MEFLCVTNSKTDQSEVEVPNRIDVISTLFWAGNPLNVARLSLTVTESMPLYGSLLIDSFISGMAVHL